MRSQGDTKRPRSVKAEFDPNFQATPVAGGILGEKTLRSLGMRRYIRDYLPERSRAAEFSMTECVYALLAGMLLGGQGMQATEALRQDRDAGRMFGFGEKAPSAPTNYRALCDLSGLVERKEEDWYEPAGPAHPSLEMSGAEKKERRLRRMVPDVPEAATEERKRQLEAFLLQTAIRCLSRLTPQALRLWGWTVGFADASDLAVEGRCFEGAEVGRDGKKNLRLLTFMLGPITTAFDLREGNRDEGRGIVAVIKQGGRAVACLGRKGQRVLVLMDAAYFEKQVIEGALDPSWDFIVCANQHRDALTRLALGQMERMWANTGADASRGWRASQVCCFTHCPEGWERPVTIVARRYQKEGEIEGVWSYSFLATRLEPADLPKKMLSEYGYCQAIWMLYGTKQGRENHYKTPLRDFGLHHPPSGRLGINQAYYTLGLVASNVAMVLRYRVLPQEDRGMAFWRLREVYFRIAGYLVQTARRLTARLTGVNVEAKRQVLWQRAFAEASRL